MSTKHTAAGAVTDDHGYTYIKEFGWLLGSPGSYIQRECDLADADDAPMDSYGHSDSGKISAPEITSYEHGVTAGTVWPKELPDGGRRFWKLTSHIGSPTTRAALNLPPLQSGG